MSQPHKNGTKDSEKSVSPNHENDEGKKTTKSILTNLLKDLMDLDNGTYNKAIEKIVLSHNVKFDKNIPASRWTLSNRILMNGQTNEDNISVYDARGRQQWKKQMNRNVKPNAKPIYILAPLLKMYCVQCSKEKNRNVTIAYDHAFKTIRCVFCKQTKDQLKQKHQYKENAIGFHPIKLFSIDSTTNGKEAEKKILDAKVKRPEIKQVIEKLGLSVDYHDLGNSGRFGYYNPRTKEIRISVESEQTLFHEIAHAIHDHLIKTDKAKKRTYAQGEVIAELSACSISRLYGIEWIGHSREYLKNYLRTKDNEKLSQVAQSLINDIGQILDFIF